MNHDINCTGHAFVRDSVGEEMRVVYMKFEFCMEDYKD